MSLDYGLLAHYPLDGDGVDISGNHNNGVNDGAVPTTDRHGNSGKAMYFNGGAYITTTNELSFPALGNADRTLSGWFKTDKDDGIIVSLGGYGANHEYALAAETIANNCLFFLPRFVRFFHK